MPHTTERKIAIENITQQRHQSRNMVRDECVEAIKAFYGNYSLKLSDLSVECQLILNPQDVNDKSIVDALWDMHTKSNGSYLTIELSKKLALLLKHDLIRNLLQHAQPCWLFWLLAWSAPRLR